MGKTASKRPRGPDRKHGRELTGGYIASGLIFAGFTALWAFIVRDDPYYRLTDLFGVRVPAMLIAYLALMPLAGFFIGRWRYDRGAGGFTRFAAKLGARALHFTYAHSLIVLFTAAMLAENWFGLDLDGQVRAIDDRLFDLVARFAPWLAAYLTGFNFGRATVARASFAGPMPDGEAQSFIEAPLAEETPEASPLGPLRAPPRRRAEPVFTDAGAPRDDRTPRPRESASGLALPAEASETPGFLPPQDLDRLRPAFSRLR